MYFGGDLFSDLDVVEVWSTNEYMMMKDIVAKFNVNYSITKRLR